MTLSSWEKELKLLGDCIPNRVAFAAVHVVVSNESGCEIDWVATDSQRSFLDSQGFGVAEAMDTAQRFDLNWSIAKQLIERVARLNLKHGFAAGASFDHTSPASLTDLAKAVSWQVNFIRNLGGLPVILPMPALAINNFTDDDFVKVYADILADSEGPVLLHWLGPMFLNSLRGYFPGDSFERVMALNPDRIIGAKLSLLDVQKELSIRHSLADFGQEIYTGDDFHFAELIAGEGDLIGDYSHAFLGILDAIARPAGLAFKFLSHGFPSKFLEIMRPCESLSRFLFQDPTHHYKAGIAYLSWLDGRQDNPWLPLRLDRKRSVDYYDGLFELALSAEVFADPSSAQVRHKSFKVC